MAGVNATVGVWLEQFYNFGPKASGKSLLRPDLQKPEVTLSVR